MGWRGGEVEGVEGWWGGGVEGVVGWRDGGVVGWRGHQARGETRTGCCPSLYVGGNSRKDAPFIPTAHVTSL